MRLDELILAYTHPYFFTMFGWVPLCIIAKLGVIEKDLKRVAAFKAIQGCLTDSDSPQT